MREKLVKTFNAILGIVIVVGILYGGWVLLNEAKAAGWVTVVHPCTCGDICNPHGAKCGLKECPTGH